MRRTLRGNVLAVTFGAATVVSIACGSSSPAAPTTNVAVINIELVTSTVEPITTPSNGWLYRVTYRAHETSGQTGATLTATHFALSTGLNADGTFSGPGVQQVPHVPASEVVTVQTNLSVLTSSPPAPRLQFTVSYTDDNRHIGSVSISADVSPITP
jgi:hypothetical protein